MIVFVFPGQGSQKPGMGRPWVQAHPGLFELASEAAGRDVVRLTCEADEAELRSTDNAQIATAACSLAALQSLRAAGVSPSCVAGHSLGEYPALVAAGALEVADAVRLVAVRGAAMARAATRHPGTMAALVGADAETAAAACEKAEAMVGVANLNAADQVVISGTEDGVAAACEAAKALGVKRALPLRVGGAFHSPLMAPALVDVALAVAATRFGDASVPVVCNVDAQPHRAAAELAPLLVAQICAPVRWQETTERLLELGARTVVEVGSGGVLQKLAKRAMPDAAVCAVASPEDVESVLAVASGDAAGRS